VTGIEHSKSSVSSGLGSDRFYLLEIVDAEGGEFVSVRNWLFLIINGFVCALVVYIPCKKMSPVLQSNCSCENAPKFGHVLALLLHKERMLGCKEAGLGVPLIVEPWNLPTI